MITHSVATVFLSRNVLLLRQGFRIYETNIKMLNNFNIFKKAAKLK